MTRESEKYKVKLEKLNDKYWDDSEFRQRKNEENKARSKARAICSEDEFAYGSTSAHSRRCRGLEGFTILEKLLRLR